MITAEQLQRYAASPAEFRADLRIDGGGGIVRFSDVIEPYQAADFAALDPGWMHCSGRPQQNPLFRAYLERPRGHSKSSDTAMMITWVLAFAPKILRGFCAASDKVQAGIIRDGVARLIAINPWLSQLLEVQNWFVKNVAAGHPGRDSSLEIMSSDVGSSYGLLPDFVVCDEITHWGSSGDQMFHSLLSSAAKRPSCMFAILTNAGTGKGESWQWKIRESAEKSPNWYFHSLDGPKASWITPETLEEQRGFLPAKVYARLWENQWCSGGDALDADDIEACVTADGPQYEPQQGFDYIAGLDLGIKRDHSALIVLGVHRKSQRLRLAQCHSWRPPKGGEVDLEDVQRAVMDAHRNFRLRSVLYDPHQAQLMAQQLRKRSVPMTEFNMSGKNQVAMACRLLEVFRSRKIDLYRDTELIRDILRLNIEPRSYGFKLEANRSAASGHADRGIALAITLTGAMELAARPQVDLEQWLAVI